MHGLNLSAFFIGVSTTFFTIFAIQVLKCRERSRFQTVLGCILAIWAVWNLKDVVLTFPQFYNKEVQNYIMLIDGWSAITYTVFIFEITMPGWTTWRKILLLSIPFLLFTAAYMVFPSQAVIYGYVLFLWFYAWTIVLIAFVKARRYMRYIRENYSNIDEIDISWLKPVFWFCIISQLSWLTVSLLYAVWSDIIYYISTICLWLIVLHYSYRFRSIEFLPPPQETHPFKDFSFAGEPERIIEERKLYLNKDLSLTDVANAVGTNRTYMSNYFSEVIGQTFYDFINCQRITKKSISLMQEHPEYTLEYIADQSGFNHISTFRRAFMKLMGKSPGSYRQELADRQKATSL